MVWTLGFSHDNAFFLTGSRDKKIVLFRLKDDLYEKVDQSLFKQSVTSVAFADKKRGDNYLACVGLENGELWTIEIE